MTAVSYLVDRIFPTKEIHIIAGASGVGKTTWAFQMLADWREAKPVLGYKSIPCPFVYVSCDRSRQSVITTLQRVGVDKVPFVDGRGISQHESRAFQVCLQMARAVNPEVRLLFVEAFGLLVPQVAFKDTYKVTGHFLSDLSRTLEAEDLTIIGTAHSPKQRDNDQISDPRQLVLGTVAWGGFVETIIAIRRLKPKDPSDMRRQILLLPRNAKEESFDFDLDENGRFVRIEPTTSFGIMNTLLETIPPDQHLTMSDFMELAEKVRSPERRTVERWVTQAVEEGRLKRISRGVYQRIRQQ